MIEILLGEPQSKQIPIDYVARELGMDLKNKTVEVEFIKARGTQEDQIKIRISDTPEAAEADDSDAEPKGSDPLFTEDT